MIRALFVIGAGTIVVLTALVPAVATLAFRKAEQWEAERSPLHLAGRDADQKPRNPNRRP